MSEESRQPHYAVTLRLKPHIGQLLEDVALKTGQSKTSVIVSAIRAYARQEGVPDREPEGAKA